MIERDVIVVGAGPAGSAAACALAQQGRDVLLVDRTAFPRDKTCGDAIPAAAVRLMRELGMGTRLDAAVERGELYAMEQLLLVSPRGVHVTAPFETGPGAAPNYIAKRLHFDAISQEHAVAAGADFQVAKVIDAIVENDQVVGVRARFRDRLQDLRAKLVVAADGVTSAVARDLRADEHEDHHRAVALRAYVDGIAELPRTIEFYLYKEILPGYAWIFPMGNGRANIGLGMRLDKFRHDKHDLKDMLDGFLDLPDIKKRFVNGRKLTGVKAWQLDFGSKPIQRAYAGALLVGDAGGLIDPVTGGGIYNAVLSATIAADVARDAFERGDFSRETLAAYDERCHVAFHKDFRRSFAIQRTLLRFPLLIDVLAGTLRSNSWLAKAFAEKL